MRDLLSDAAQRAIGYLEHLDRRSVVPTPAALARLRDLDRPLPTSGADPLAVLAELDEIGSPATVATAGGRFFGFVIGGALPATVAANWLATAWDQEAGMPATSPATVAIEAVAHRWLLELFGLPSTCATAFVTGATMANFTALAAARNAVLARLGWNVEADGLIGAPPVPVYVGAEVHPTARKALGLLGFGRNRPIELPVDDQGRIRADRLPPLAGPALVLAQAGNVNTGAADPIAALADWVHGAGGWLHVDGAFGLWAAASPAYAHLVAGFEAADSWATDAHKWLNVPYDSGVAIVTDAEALQRAMGLSAAYLPLAAGRQPDRFTPELSRRARGVEVWAALATLGRAGVADLVDRCCRHARRFAAGLTAAGFPILNDVVLNQVLVAFGPGEVNDRVAARIQADGVCWCGVTEWQGRRAVRISVSSWATTDADVERSLTAILGAAAAVRGG
ncbi:MAG: aspartate aminotransferase family protein [Gemmatimonadetes bacterium]|nr:aspartate aminotransferase family protein [Gemmatimonadota bacterium]